MELRSKYCIVFEFPEGTVFAGVASGALGFAPTLDTAELYESREAAVRTLRNGYGKSVQSFAHAECVDDLAVKAEI